MSQTLAFSVLADPAPSPNGASFSKLNPYTQQGLGHYPVFSPAQVGLVVQAAQKALPPWQQATLKQRATVLKRWASKLRQHQQALAQLVTAEVGKPLTESYQADLLSALGSLDWIASHGPAVLKPQHPFSPTALLFGRQTHIRYQPWGVVAVITPWNYPLATPVGSIAAALIAGNTVVFKPSELTPGCGQRVWELLVEALKQSGFSADVAGLVHGERTTGQALVEHPEVAFTVFTGSESGGRHVEQTMRAKNGGSNLELGGSDPMIVLASALKTPAQVDFVSSAIVWGRFANAGQTCAAVKRLLVQRSAYPVLLEALKTKLNALNLGNPLHPQTHLGPLISHQQRYTLQAQVQDAEDRGALVFQAKLPEGLPAEAPFYPPTLILEAPTESRPWREEVFGPALVVGVFDTPEEAITLANGLPYALGASVFGEKNEAQALAQGLQAGIVAINDLPVTAYALPDIPWGGWKASGPGVRHSAAGLLSLTRAQSVLQPLGDLKKAPFWFSPLASNQQGQTEVQSARALVALSGGIPSLGPLFWLVQRLIGPRL